MQARQGVIMDIETTRFTRAAVSRFGIAPRTSMYFSRKPGNDNLVPLAPSCTIPTASACDRQRERLWRPRNNPPPIIVSAFRRQPPRASGFASAKPRLRSLQDGVNYDRSPTLGVEPRRARRVGVGQGAIQLC